MLFCPPDDIPEEGECEDGLEEPRPACQQGEGAEGICVEVKLFWTLLHGLPYQNQEGEEWMCLEEVLQRNKEFQVQGSSSKLNGLRRKTC